MPTPKSPFHLYIEKLKEVYSLEDVKEAFHSSYAVCFNFERTEDFVSKKRKLIMDILCVNPDVILTEADLCILGSEPIVLRDQQLLINKKGTHDMAREITKLMSECGIISYEYRFVTEETTGTKISYGSIGADEKSHRRFKGNLLIDGAKLMLTARHMTKADSAALKSEKLKE